MLLLTLLLSSSLIYYRARVYRDAQTAAAAQHFFLRIDSASQEGICGKITFLSLKNG